MTYTETGQSLIVSAITLGEQIRFSRVVLIADPERSGAELEYQMDIATVDKRDSKTIVIKAITDNYDFTSDYYFNQINVYASGEDGEELLFCFQKSVTCPFYIPKYDGRPVKNEISIYIAVSTTDVIDVSNDGVYVLRTEFTEQMRNKSNIVVVMPEETMPERKTNTWYLKVTDKQAIAASDNIKVSPSMAIKLV